MMEKEEKREVSRLRGQQVTALLSPVMCSMCLQSSQKNGLNIKKHPVRSVSITSQIRCDDKSFSRQMLSKTCKLPLNCTVLATYARFFSVSIETSQPGSTSLV